MSEVHARDMHMPRRPANDQTVQPLQLPAKPETENRENFKANAVAVEAVDTPVAGGDEMVMPQPEKLQEWARGRL